MMFPEKYNAVAVTVLETQKAMQMRYRTCLSAKEIEFTGLAETGFDVTGLANLVNFLPG